MFLLETTAVTSVLGNVLRGRPDVAPAKAKFVVSVAKARLPTRVATQKIGPLVRSIKS
jgi:hypothetical protein